MNEPSIGGVEGDWLMVLTVVHILHGCCPAIQLFERSWSVARCHGQSLERAKPDQTLDTTFSKIDFCLLPLRVTKSLYFFLCLEFSWITELTNEFFLSRIRRFQHRPATHSWLVNCCPEIVNEISFLLAWKLIFKVWRWKLTKKWSCRIRTEIIVKEFNTSRKLTFKTRDK